VIGAELEALLRKLVREEVARLVGVEPDALPEDDAELRQLAQDRAAKLRSRRSA
jgi:hypothetical protein